MTHDPFENNLQDQAFQPPPASWKKEILAEASRHLPTPDSGNWWLQLREWLLPHRLVYAAIGAAWILILFFHATTPRDPASERIAQEIKNSPHHELSLIAHSEQERLQRQLQQNLGL